MNAILFLWRKSLKNRILQLKNQPAQLVLFLFVAVMIGIAVFGSLQMPDDILDITPAQSAARFGAVAFVLPLLFYLLNAWSGFSKSAGFFSMADVHLLFPAPISPRKILLTGLVRGVGVSLLAAVILLAQAANLKNMTGVGFEGILALMAGVIPAMLLGQLSAVAIYRFCLDGRGRKIALQCVLGAIPLVLLAAVLLAYRQSGDLWGSVLNVLNAGWARWLPVAGWGQGVSCGILYADWGSVALFAGLLLVFAGLLILIFVLGDCDYYEDVIGGAEQRQKAKELVKADGGNNIRAATMNRKIRVKDTGIGKGSRASAIFYMHLRQLKRNRFLFADFATFMSLIMAVFMLLVLQMSDPTGEIPTAALLLISLGMAAYMYLFFSMTGIWAQELKKPYIFLLPDSAPKKLLYATGTTIVKSIFDGVIIALVIGIYLEVSPLVMVASALAFASCGCIFVGGDVLSQRIFKRQINTGILRFVNILLLFVLLIPGLAAAIGGAVAGMAFGIDICLTAPGALAVVNAGVFLLLLAGCKNVLAQMDV